MYSILKYLFKCSIYASKLNYFLTPIQPKNGIYTLNVLKINYSHKNIEWESREFFLLTPISAPMMARQVNNDHAIKIRV